MGLADTELELELKLKLKLEAPSEMDSRIAQPPGAATEQKAAFGKQVQNPASLPLSYQQHHHRTIAPLPPPPQPMELVQARHERERFDGTDLVESWMRSLYVGGKSVSPTHPFSLVKSILRLT